MTPRWRSALTLGRLVPAFLVLGLLKHVVPLPALARLAWRPPRPNHRGHASRMTSLVLRAGRMAGFPDRDCVQRSVLLYRELSACGAHPELVVGFRRVSGRLEGHAWVRVDGDPIGEGGEALASFGPAFVFGANGVLVEPAASRPTSQSRQT